MAGLFSDFDPYQAMAANQYASSARPVTRGSLVSFEYPRSQALSPNVIHDPRPMVIITDIWPPHYIRGVNLHYLTFPYVKKILEMWAGNQSFNYSLVRADRYVASAFRMYNMRGIRRPKRLDSDWLKTILASVRSFDPGEIEKIKANIQQQIQARLQAKANELTAYDKWKADLAKADQRTLNTKVQGVQDALTGGVQQNLITPPTFGNMPPAPEAAQTTQPPTPVGMPENTPKINP